MIIDVNGTLAKIIGPDRMARVTHLKLKYGQLYISATDSTLLTDPGPMALKMRFNAIIGKEVVNSVVITPNK